MASSTTRPTATARPPRVMTLSVRPATCISTRPVRTESGMLIAATSVERRLNRNRKIVMIGEDRAEAALAQQPVLRLEDEVRQVLDDRHASARRDVPPAASLSTFSTACATCTVLADDVLVTTSVSDGLPSVRE